MAEILNIDYHTERLVKEALMVSENVGQASERLQVSKRTVFRYMLRYDIDYAKIREEKAEMIKKSKKKIDEAK